MSIQFEIHFTANLFFESVSRCLTCAITTPNYAVCNVAKSLEADTFRVLRRAILSNASLSAGGECRRLSNEESKKNVKDNESSKHHEILRFDSAVMFWEG
jgi:hypothetical protein